jgi:6-phosphogluconolactonase
MPQLSAGVTPFGFAFDAMGHLVVSEANAGAPGASTISSYCVREDGILDPMTAALPTGQTAACWVAATPHKPFAYVTNTGSDSITGLAITQQGQILRLGGSANFSRAGDGPIDAAVSRQGHYLFVLNGGDDTIRSYRIGADGVLHPLKTTAGLPPAVNGLAVR